MLFNKKLDLVGHKRKEGICFFLQPFKTALLNCSSLPFDKIWENQIT